MITVDFSEAIAASDLKQMDLMKIYVSIKRSRSFLDLGQRSCTYKNSNWIFFRNYCADLNQILYESFQVYGN